MESQGNLKKLNAAERKRLPLVFKFSTGHVISKWSLPRVHLPGSFSLSESRRAEIENESQRHNPCNAIRRLEESQEVIVKR